MCLDDELGLVFYENFEDLLGDFVLFFYGLVGVCDAGEDHPFLEEECWRQSSCQAWGVDFWVYPTPPGFLFLWGRRECGCVAEGAGVRTAPIRVDGVVHFRNKAGSFGEDSFGMNGGNFNTPQFSFFVPRL